MSEQYVVYGAAGSGSVPVEAALTLIGADFRVVERPTWESEAIREEMATVNPLRQVPALILPSGELMTESAAILIHLADTHPQARLAPAVGDPMRPRFLRWMAYIGAQIYGLYWVRDDLSRLADGKAAEAVVDERTKARITSCWAMMDGQVSAEGRFLLGDQVSVLDLYLAVVSRWRPNRRRFAEAAPGLATVAKAVDAEPRLQAFWAERFPFEDGWEG